MKIAKYLTLGVLFGLFLLPSVVGAQATSTASIRIVSPNGGEHWRVGTIQPVQWATTGTIATSSLNLSWERFAVSTTTPVATGTIATPLSNTGVYNWRLPLTFAPGNQYKVRISAYGWSGTTWNYLVDKSDDFFTILGVSPSPEVSSLSLGRQAKANQAINPTVTVTVPNGGERWNVGSTRQIRWTTQALPYFSPTQVRWLLFSATSSTTTPPIAAGWIATSTINSGSFNWAIPLNLTTSNRYKVEVFVMATSTGTWMTDTSDNYFTINRLILPPINANLYQAAMVTQGTSNSLPSIGLAQTSNTQTSLPIKCGGNTFAVNTECGVGAFKSAYVQCHDGYEITLGDDGSSCKSSETWSQYAKEVCVNRCSTGGKKPNEPNVIPEPFPSPIPAPRLTPVPNPFAVCQMSDNLMQKYDRFLLELQKSESDKVKAEEISRKIIALKQEMERQQKECANTSRPGPLTPPIGGGTDVIIENKPVTVPVDRCGEVAQWEGKFGYYKKLSGLSDADLKREGFSREEIEKILRNLPLGLEEVKAQCSNQSGTITAPPTPPTMTSGSFPTFTESVKPVVVESGREIGAYYKTRLEKTASAKGTEKQIEELKTLRGEIDELISNLIKSRKELEVSELNTLVKEVKVSRGEIKADNVAVKTTGKKMLINLGDRPVSIEPTASQVLIRDKGLEVKTDAVTMKENVLSVGGVAVKMSASEVAEKLDFAPKTTELKEENAKAVYNMGIEERRNLFGFIPLDIQKTVVADAENGKVLEERFPWYRFLTTK